MALEDFVDPEVGIAVAATALVASPRARNVVRQGLVYGLAGIFKLGDAISSGAASLTQGAQRAATSTGDAVGDMTRETRAKARGQTGAAQEPVTGE